MLAETAQLAVNLHLGTTGSFSGATSQLKGVEAAAAGASGRGISTLQAGFGRASMAAGKFGGALGHAKHSVGELLTGPLGVLGLAGGVGGLGVGIEKVISHTNDFAFSVEKLTNLTGGSAESMSTLLAVFEKFNIDAQRTGQIVGFAEKTLGKLAGTSTVAGKSGANLAKAQDAVTKAQERLSVATQRLHEIQSKGKTSASQLAAARFKVRDATAALTQAENTLASDRASKGITSTSKLIALDKEYGLHLVDSKGKLVDFETELKQVADVYTSSLDPARKAALAAQLFGRGYADLVPILALGSKGITEAEQAAKDLGLTLTSQNAKDLKDYRESLRETGDAIGGLELQLGLALVPAIKDMADAITRFLRNGGREQLVSFFKNVISAARDLAGFITGTVVPTLVTIGSAAKTAWDAIPAPLRDLLVKGFVADKALKFTFGFSPISFAKDALGGLVGDFFKKGGTPANPLFVADVTGGLGGVGAAAGGAAASAALPIAVIAAAIIGPTLVAIKESNDNSGIATGIGSSVNTQTSGGASIASLQQSLAALDKGISDLSNMWGAQLVSGDAIDQLKAQRAEVVAAIQRQTDATNLAGRDTIGGVDQAAKRSDANAELNARRIEAAENRTGMLVNSSGKVLAKQAAASTLAFRAVEGQLKHAKTADQVKAAIKAAMTTIFAKSLGGTDSTGRVLRDLKAQLSHTHDPKLEAALRAAIGRVETKLASRQLVADQLKVAQHILHSSESTKQKIAELKAVEQRIGDRSKVAIARVEHAIEVAKRAQVIASKLAGHEAAAAIKDKDLSVTVNVKTNISARNFTKALATSTKFGIS